MDIKISVIIPVYNTDIGYIDVCLNSVINNTLKEIEILIMDDGSKENVVERLKYYEKSDERVRLFRLNHKGVSNARNTGIKNACGKYIMFIDSDDWIDNKYFEIYYKTAEEYDADIVTGNIIIREKYDDDMIKFNSNNINMRNDIERTYPQKQMFYKGYAGLVLTESPCSKIYKKEFLKRFNILFLEKLTIGEDSIFNFNVYQNADNMIFFDYTGYAYRYNCNSAIHGYNKNRKVCYEELFKAYSELIERYNLQKKFYGDVENFMVRIAIDAYFSDLYFHPGSNMSNAEIKEAIKQFVNEPLYCDAFKKCDIKKFNIKRKVFIWLFRHKLWRIIYCYYAIILRFRK